MLSKLDILQKLRDNESFVLQSENLKNLPNRMEIFNERYGNILISNFRNHVITKKPLYFNPLTWEAPFFGERSELIVVGILPCGSKTLVTIKNLNIFVDIGMETTYLGNPLTLTQNELLVLVSEYAYKKATEIEKTEIVYLFPMHGFYKEKQPFLRVFFKTNNFRKILIDYLQNNGTYLFNLANNDLTNLPNIFIRNNGWNASKWNRIINYTVCKPQHNLQYNISVDAADFNAVSEEKIETLISNTELYNSLKKLNFITLSWDIETHRTIENGEVPTPADNDWNIPVIGACYNTCMSNEPFLDIHFTIYDSDPHPDCKTIVVCKNEVDLLKSYMYVANIIKPDILQAFNCGSFDWPNLLHKYSQNNLLQQFIQTMASTTIGKKFETWNIQRKTLKIDADSNIYLNKMLNVSGVVDTDVMAIFQRIYTKSTVSKMNSLNFFLKENKLESKNDLPYREMFAIFDRAIALNKNDPEAIAKNKREISNVVYYCKIDCARLQQLCHKRLIFSEFIELSQLSEVTLENCYYNAGGMKVRNFLLARAFRTGVAMSNLQNNNQSTYTYTGGKVFEPVSNRINDMPVFGVDATSLYPSIIITKNISPDMVVTNEQEAKKLISEGYTLHYVTDPTVIKKKHGEEKGELEKCEGWIVQHNNVNNNECIINWKRGNTIIEPQKLKLRKSVSNEKLCESLIELQKENEEFEKPNLIRPALKGERLGFLVSVVKELFNARVPLKKQLMILTKFRENYEITGQPIIINGIELSITELEFKLGALDTKQRAIKVLANIVYGESGNSRSSIFNIIVAAGITAYGRQTLIAVSDFVEFRNCKKYYGDTDSVYISPPQHLLQPQLTQLEKLFIDRDNATDAEIISNLNKEIYCNASERVEIAINYASVICKEIGDYLLLMNNSRLLQFAYEEVGLPTMFFGKKKYALKAHIGKPNWSEQNEPFVRGIDIVKQNCTPIAKILGNEFLKTILDPTNNEDPENVTKFLINEYFKRKWPIEMYVLTAKYKPLKQNKMVHKFVARMKILRDQYEKLQKHDLLAYCKEPAIGDPFQYVICKVEQQYDFTGKMIPIAIGDKMEYITWYNFCQNQNILLEIDYVKYFKNVKSVFARFIRGIYDEPLVNNEDYKIWDTKCVKAAEKKISEWVSGSITVNKNREVGVEFRKIYKNKLKDLASKTKTSEGNNIILKINTFTTDNENIILTFSNDIEIVEFCSAADSLKNYRKNNISVGDAVFKNLMIYKAGLVAEKERKIKNELLCQINKMREINLFVSEMLTNVAITNIDLTEIQINTINLFKTKIIEYKILKQYRNKILEMLLLLQVVPITKTDVVNTLMKKLL